MKLNALVISLHLCVLGHGVLHADGIVQDKSAKVLVKNFRFLGPSLLYTYNDFNYDSTAGDNFQRFQGHSNLYGFSGGSLFISERILMGLGFYQVDSTVNTQTLLNPSPLMQNHQSIENNTLYGSLSKVLSEQWLVNATGGYGHNTINSQLLFTPTTSPSVQGFSKNSADNWFGSLSAFYYKAYRQFLFQGNLTYLYSYINTPDFNINYPSFGTAAIASSKNKSNWLIENAELDFKMNQTITPFVSAGLIQALSSSASQAPITTAIIGSLPQLSAFKSGYQAGGGVKLSHNRMSLIVQYKYYNSGNIYTSNQTSATLSYSMG